jgi:Uma2 family endonuclease
LHSPPDDGIVVAGGTMPRRSTVAAYVAGAETNRPRELAYGVLREPPAPGFDHQITVGRIYARLDRHVRRQAAGVVVMSPIDVILDHQNHLIVQPDIVFVRTSRLGICRTQVWGAPDLVVEVLSMGNARRDRVIKIPWYRKYGVGECWLVDMAARTIEVLDLAASLREPHTFQGPQTIRSASLPRLRLKPADIFDDLRN